MLSEFQLKERVHVVLHKLNFFLSFANLISLPRLSIRDFQMHWAINVLSTFYHRDITGITVDFMLCSYLNFSDRVTSNGVSLVFFFLAWTFRFNDGNSNKVSELK